MKIYNVVLVGTRWGQSYILPIIHCDTITRHFSRDCEAFLPLYSDYLELVSKHRKSENSEPHFRLTGILGKGSQRSVNLARNLNVPFYRNASDIPSDTDIACVAVGQKDGITLAKELLKKGINVIKEHSVSSAGVKELLGVAEEYGRRFHVNYHFGDCEPSSDFIKEAIRLNLTGRPVFIQMNSHVRSLPSLFDIIGRIFGTLEPFSSENIAQSENSFITQRGSISGVPFIHNCQTSIGVVDDGSDIYLTHNITFIYPSGILVLIDSINGPAIWFENHVSHCGRAKSSAFDVMNPLYFREMLLHPGELDYNNDKNLKWRILNNNYNDKAADVTSLRLAANRLALEKIVHHIETGQPPSGQEPDYLLQLAIKIEKARGQVLDC